MIVIAPLKSIVDDQISEMLSQSCTAMELTMEALNVVRDSPPQFLYCSAALILEKAFLATLKENSAYTEPCRRLLSTNQTQLKLGQEKGEILPIRRSLRPCGCHV